MMKLTLCTVALVVVLAAPARALIHFDFEQKYFIELPEPVLDHTVVRDDDGVYHLFYLRGNPAVNIGHATTTDFAHWDLQPPILAPGGWKDLALWAPYIHRRYGTWFMFYTGVNSAWAQRTGVALSDDLYDWYDVPYPVYTPDTSWAEWDIGSFSPGRDPYVIEQGGKYYQVVTALTNGILGAVGCAESTDLINWIDIGPMYVHDSWHVLESVFIKERAGKYHMFFTEEVVNGTSHMVADSLFNNWDIGNRRILDAGHAPEITALPNGDDLFSRYSVFNDGLGNPIIYVIRFDTLTWIGDEPYVSKPWGLAKNWTQKEGLAFKWQPTFMNNPAMRGEDVEPTFQGFFWVGTKEFSLGPLGGGYPGGQVGEGWVGVMESRRFVLAGNSMNLLVGGTDDPGVCAVRLVRDATGEVLFEETGKNVEEMDRRYWNVFPYKGETVFVEVRDSSLTGHINVDDIVESYDFVQLPNYGEGDGNHKRGFDNAMTSSGYQLKLGQNAPNPFNPSTMIMFETPGTAQVGLAVYDVAGGLVRRLVSREMHAGRHEVEWDGRYADGTQAASGVYFYRLTFDGKVVDTRRMVLVK